MYPTSDTNISDHVRFGKKTIAILVLAVLLLPGVSFGAAISWTGNTTAGFSALPTASGSLTFNAAGTAGAVLRQ